MIYILTSDDIAQDTEFELETQDIYTTLRMTLHRILSLSGRHRIYILTLDDIAQDTEFEQETHDIYTYFG